MIRRTLAIGALMGFLCGCAAAATNDPSQWAARYHKQGATSQQLTDDGAACLGASPSPWTGTATAVWVGGSRGPVLPGPESRMVDLDPFTDCMKTKGYTVTP
jgi:hypothetical protein